MSEVETGSRLACAACHQALAGSDEAGWECDCGVLVCQEAACFEEYFKRVGGGEGVRCRSCGHLS